MVIRSISKSQQETDSDRLERKPTTRIRCLIQGLSMLRVVNVGP